MTITVEEHLAKKIAEVAEGSGLSNSAVVNTCLRFALPKLENGPLLNPAATPRARKSVAILLVEDSQADADLVSGALRHADYEPKIHIVQTAKEMQKALREGGWDFILSDWFLPEFSGLEALQLHRMAGEKAPIIIVSGRIGEEATAEAMRAGADDYVLKDRLETLVPAMERILARRSGQSAASPSSHSQSSISQASQSRASDPVR